MTHCTAFLRVEPPFLKWSAPVFSEVQDDVPDLGNIVIARSGSDSRSKRLAEPSQVTLLISGCFGSDSENPSCLAPDRVSHTVIKDPKMVPPPQSTAAANKFSQGIGSPPTKGSSPRANEQTIGTKHMATILLGRSVNG